MTYMREGKKINEGVPGPQAIRIPGKVKGDQPILHRRTVLRIEKTVRDFILVPDNGRSREG